MTEQELYATLSGRERQVLQLIAEGKTTKEIGIILGMATKTAETHRTSLQRTLDISGVANITRFAIRIGIVTA